MKRCLLFVRGVHTEYKKSVVKALMAALNPGPDHVSAIRVSMWNYVPDLYAADKGIVRAAHRNVKNLVKKVYQHHNERFIVIDNESLRPVDWQSFIDYVAHFHQPTEVVSLEVVSDPKILTPEQTRRSNLQERKKGMFISISPKYYECNGGDPKPVIEALVRDTRESNDVHAGTGKG